MASRATRGLGIRFARPHVTGLIAMAVAGALSAWLVVDNSRSSAPSVGAELPSAALSSPSGYRIAPIVLSGATLRTRVRSLGEPVYWVGPASGEEYELSRDEDRRVFLRYLPAGTPSGDQNQRLTIATLPYKDAFLTTQALAKQPGVASKTLSDGGVAWYRRDRPRTVYLAHPFVDYVVQVVDLSPGRARELVFAGRVREVV